MNRIATALLSLAGLTCLAADLSAQAAPIPQIASVPQRKSYSPGNVVINGSNLGLALGVKINGVSFPIIRTNATRLIVGPVTPQDPGFGTVEVIHGRGVQSAPISLLPTLSGERRYTRINLVLNNGDTGTYILRYSYSFLGTPVTDQGFYGKRYLAFASSILDAGVIPDANPLAINGILLPVQIGLIGAPVNLQAECTADTAGLTAYTNMLTVLGFGQHQ